MKQKQLYNRNFEPENGDVYYYIKANDEIKRRTWTSSNKDWNLYTAFNCFETLEDAKEKLTQNLVRRCLEDSMYELNGDKSNPNGCLYFICLDKNGNVIIFESLADCLFSPLFFTTKDDALVAVCRVSQCVTDSDHQWEEVIKKYYFGIE